MHAGGPEGYELGNSYRSTQAWRLASEAKRAASQGRYAIVVSILLPAPCPCFPSDGIFYTPPYFALYLSS
jgi:hypothetical protein